MITVTFTLREALALLTVSLEARLDRHDERQGLKDAEYKLTMAIQAEPEALGRIGHIGCKAEEVHTRIK